MKITAFNDLYSNQLTNGTEFLVASTGSNAGFSPDVVGSPGDLTVVQLQNSVALGSNLGTGVSIGDVLTIISTGTLPVARFATPSNSGSAGSNNVILGALSADGSPQTIVNDAKHNNFPGLVRLDANRVLCVYRRGDDHVTNGDIYGQIGILAADKGSVTSWGTQFLIYSHATEDVRCEDGAAIIDNKVVIYARLYDGTNNHAPFILVSDVAPGVLVPSSTWTNYSVTLTHYTKQNYSQGHMLKLQDGTYLLPYGGQDNAANHEVGVLKSSSMTDWSAPTRVVVGPVGTNDYSEIAVNEMPGGELRAHIRENNTNNNHYKVYSGNRGTTWGTPATLFTASGYPMWRRLSSGLGLSVYRQATNGDSFWRSATDSSDQTWSSETLLDATGTRNAYASLLQLTDNKILCAYAVEYSSDGSTGGADVFSQIFTDSSTFEGLHQVSVDDNDLTALYLNDKLAAGSNVTFTIEQPFGSEVLRIAATAGTPSAGSNSTAVREGSTAGASTTLFSPFDHAHDGVWALSSSSSNTLQRGLVNLRAGAGIGLTATDTDGDGEFDTVTISGQGSGGGGGGSSPVAIGRIDGDGSADVTTTSTSFVDLTGASITLTTGARPVLVGFVGTTLNNGTSNINTFTVRVDSTDYGGTLGFSRWQDSVANIAHGVAFTWMSPTLSAGSHTFKIRWLVSAGTGTVKNLSASAIWHMFVQEIPT